MIIHFNAEDSMWQLGKTERLPKNETAMETLQEAFNVIAAEQTRETEFGQMLLADLSYLSQSEYGFRKGWVQPKNRILIYAHENHPNAPLTYVALADPHETAETLVTKLNQKLPIRFQRVTQPELLFKDPFGKWMDDASPVEHILDQVAATKKGKVGYLTRRYNWEKNQFAYDINLQTPYLQNFVLPKPDFFAPLEDSLFLDDEWGNSEVLELLSRMYPINGVGLAQLRLEIECEWTTMLRFSLVDGIGEPLRVSRFIDEEMLFAEEQPHVKWANGATYAAITECSAKKAAAPETAALWEHLRVIAADTPSADILRVLQQLKAKVVAWERQMESIDLVWGSQVRLDWEKNNPEPPKANSFNAIPDEKLQAIFEVQREVDQTVEQIIRAILSHCYQCVEQKETE